MSSLSSMSLIYTSVLYNRLTIAYSADFAANHLSSLAPKDLSCSLFGPQTSTKYDEQLKTTISTLKEQKLLAKIEFLKTSLYILHVKKLDGQNFDQITNVLSLAFTIDSNEDLGIQQLVTLFQRTITRLPGMLSVNPEVRDRFAEFLSQQLDTVTSIDSIKAIIGLVGLTVERTVSPAASALIEKVARDQRIPLRETIEFALRHQVFSKLRNAELYGYAKQIYQKVNTAAQQK